MDIHVGTNGAMSRIGRRIDAITAVEMQMIDSCPFLLLSTILFARLIIGNPAMRLSSTQLPSI